MNKPARRWPLIVAGTLAVLLIVAFAAFQFAIKSLKSQVEQALGPHGEVNEIRVTLTGVEITGIRIRAPESSGKNAEWPAEDQLRAERILIVPALRDLLSAKVVLRNIRIEGAYVSMLRAKDGRMHVLPSLLEQPSATDEEKSGMPSISIDKVELANSVVEFYDATIRKPPHKIRLEQINARLESLHLPDLTGQSQLSIDGLIKGVHNNGQIAINGAIELATKESEMTTRLRNVDLIALQPYLIKAAETGVRQGTLDLDLKSTVHKGKLHAPGTLTLKGLELASTGSASFMGMPRNAVVASMKDKNGQISIQFVLDGNINDPHFSLNENLMTRVGSSMAGALGVSIEGLAKGVGTAGSGIAKGVSDSVDKLFGK